MIIIIVIVYYIKVGFVPGVQGWLNIQKSYNHINKLLVMKIDWQIITFLLILNQLTK